MPTKQLQAAFDDCAKSAVEYRKTYTLLMQQGAELYRRRQAYEILWEKWCTQRESAEVDDDDADEDDADEDEGHGRDIMTERKLDGQSGSPYVRVANSHFDGFDPTQALALTHSFPLVPAICQSDMRSTRSMSTSAGSATSVSLGSGSLRSETYSSNSDV